MSEKSCATCFWFAPSTRGDPMGDCYAPLPIHVLESIGLVRGDDGQLCEAWKWLDSEKTTAGDHPADPDANVPRF